MKNALKEFIVDGVPTTIPFHQRVIEHPDFAAGNYNLDFVDKIMLADKQPPTTKLTLQRPAEATEVIETEPVAPGIEDKS